jgi:hypothetical protein
MRGSASSPAAAAAVAAARFFGPAMLSPRGMKKRVSGSLPAPARCPHALLFCCCGSAFSFASAAADASSICMHFSW